MTAHMCTKFSNKKSQVVEMMEFWSGNNGAVADPGMGLWGL